MNFQEDLKINLDDLHIEWKNHAQKRHQYASEISDLDRKVKKCHEKLKVKRSQLIRDAFKDPEGTCESKKSPTGPMLEAYYRTHPDHKKAKDDLIQAEYDLSMAYNATRAMDDRKFALQDCVKLYLNNYFSTPREERIVEPEKSINKLQDEKREEAQTAQRKSLKPKDEKREEVQTVQRRRRRKK